MSKSNKPQMHSSYTLHGYSENKNFNSIGEDDSTTCDTYVVVKKICRIVKIQIKGENLFTKRIKINK